MIAWLHACHALANGFDDASTLVSKHDWKGAFRIFARESVCICVTDAGVVDFDSDFVSSRRLDFDLFDAEVFASFPRNSSLLVC